MSQSSAPYRTIALLRARNLKTTATQAMVKQMAFAAMILGPLSSEMCISCSRISAGVGMVAMLSEDPGVILHCAEDGVVSRNSYRREGKRPIWTFEVFVPILEPSW